MKVSVLITSYNRAAFLKRAIDSVLMQQADFPFEVVIADDGSTDGSADIISKYADFPNVVIVMNSHVGMMRNYISALDSCTGEYVAFCDCDDYFVAKDKLKVQAEFMDKTGCGVTFTKMWTYKDGHYHHMKFCPYINDTYAFDTLLMGNQYLTPQTLMIRRELLVKYAHPSKWMKLWFMYSDYPTLLELSKRSKFFCLNYYTAVYTKHSDSLSHTVSRCRRLRVIINLAKVRAYFILKYGCHPYTVGYLSYKLVRDLASVVMKRWCR